VLGVPATTNVGRTVPSREDEEVSSEASEWESEEQLARMVEEERGGGKRLHCDSV